MAKKKKGTVCFCLPNWKNPVAGKSVYLYTAGLLYQLMALGLPYWNVKMLPLKEDPPLQLTVFGWTDKEAMYDGEKFPATIIKMRGSWYISCSQYFGHSL